MKHFVLVAIMCLGLGGCAAQNAPSLVLIGIHFPAWMLAAGLGIATAIAIHVATVATGLAEAMRQQLLSCTAVGATTAAVWWLIWFTI